LWGLRAEEVRGKNFLNLDFGLPVEQLRQPLKACAHQESGLPQEILLDSVNRRGKAFQCKVTCIPPPNQRIDHFGAILLMEENADGQGP
jgi:two-component system CheB/CheR fusion protein